MKSKKYEEVRNVLKSYRLLQNELRSRTEYISEFRRILIQPLSKDEEVLRKVYNNIISEMVKNALKLQKNLKVLESITERLSGQERNIIYFRYIKGIDWVNMPEYMMYEQRTCQLFEVKALEKILKMNIDWSDFNVD